MPWAVFRFLMRTNRLAEPYRTASYGALAILFVIVALLLWTAFRIAETVFFGGILALVVYYLVSAAFRRVTRG